MKRTSSICALVRGAGLVSLALLLPAGCDPDDILDVEDPDIVIEPPKTASGAIALKNGVFRRLAEAVSGTQSPDALFLFAGLLTDEWRSGDTFVQRNNQDQRIFQPDNTFNAGPYRNLNRVRTQAKMAIDALRDLAPDPVSNVGMMFAIVAYVETLIAEHYCNGTPLSEPDPVTAGAIIYGEPLTNDSVFSLGIAHADSALANRSGSADSNKVKWIASIVKARALVGRGQYTAAAAVIGTVPPPVIPDTFKFQVTHSLNVNDNQMWRLNVDARRYTPADLEGGVGVNFVSANDPRLPRCSGRCGGPRTVPDRIFDTQWAFAMPLVRAGIWGRTSPVNIVTGIEARLLEAEAALRAGQATTWLNIINALRTNTALYPPIEAATAELTFTRGANLTAIADTFSNQASRENTMFRERAFWFFSTGHRLGDMRRLVRPVAQGGYGRAETTVYPNGAYVKGGSYGTAIQMALPFQEINNPLFTQCLDLNP